MVVNPLKKWFIFVLLLLVFGVLLLLGYFLISPSKLEIKRLFTNDNKPYPLGIDKSIGEFSTSSDGLKRVWLSGIITEEPYEEIGVFLLPISFDEKSLGDHDFLALGKRESNLGFNVVRNGQIDFSGEVVTKQVQEILGYLKPGVQVRLEVILEMNDERFNSIIQDSRCDELCEGRLLEIRHNLNDTQVLINSLYEESYLSKGKIFGPALTIYVSEK